jgi:hypothetical protein
MTGEWNSLRSSIAQETLKDLFSLKQGKRILIFYLFVPTYFVYLFNNFFLGPIKLILLPGPMVSCYATAPFLTQQKIFPHFHG